MLTIIFYTLFLFLPFASPSPINASHVSGGEEYVVIVDKTKTCGRTVLSRLGLSPEHTDVRHLFDNAAFRGFAASMKTHCLDALAGMTDVMHVERAVRVKLHNYDKLDSRDDNVRASSPWGLQRSSSAGYMFGDDMTLRFDYAYSSADLGAGVDIYMVDTGIYSANQEFGDRAKLGFTFDPADDSLTNDANGHGTHTAGTAAGATFGVASNANIIAVKAMGADGAGTLSNTIAGMDFVVNQHTWRKTQPGFRGSGESEQISNHYLHHTAL